MEEQKETLADVQAEVQAKRDPEANAELHGAVERIMEGAEGLKPPGWSGPIDRLYYRNEAAKNVLASMAMGIKAEFTNTHGGAKTLGQSMARRALYLADCLVEAIEEEEENQA